MSEVSQIAELANFIMAEIDGEPSRSEGAVDCAIRLLRAQRPQSEVRIGIEGSWCFGCGLDYGDDWPGDFVLQDHIWRAIKPFKEHKEGLLCPNCMISRLKEVGYSGTIWGPQASLQSPTPEAPTESEIEKLIEEILNIHYYDNVNFKRVKVVLRAVDGIGNELRRILRSRLRPTKEREEL